MTLNSKSSATKGFVLIVISLFNFSLGVHAQLLNKVHEVTIEQPVAVSLDRQGAVLFADKGGNIYKMSRQGKIDLTYSPERNAKTDLIEAWTTLDIMSFSESLQTVQILNRFLSPISTIDLSPYAGFVRLATYNYQSNIWMIDDSDFSLKLFDTDLNQVTISTPFNLLLDPQNYQLGFIREYQNQLFISDFERGILVFDNLGNYIGTIPAVGVAYFGFLANEIYYLVDNQVFLTDIYSRQKRVIEVIPARFCLVDTDRIYLLGDETISVYTY